MLVGLTQGMGIFLVNNNLPASQGAFGASAAEASWLSAAYSRPASSAISLLTKMRLQFGLRQFAGYSIGGFVFINLLLLGAPDLTSAIFVRAATGIIAAPQTT